MPSLDVTANSSFVSFKKSLLTDISDTTACSNYLHNFYTDKVVFPRHSVTSKQRRKA